MPNGYATRQIYFRSQDHDVLEFVDSMGRGERSKYIVEAIREKRARGQGQTLEDVMRVLARIEQRLADGVVVPADSGETSDADRAAVEKVFGAAAKTWGK